MTEADLFEFEIESSDLRFKIESRESGWEILWYNRKNIFESFFIIPEDIIVNNILYNSRRAITQQLKLKFQTYCKSYGQYHEIKNIERLTEAFIDRLVLNLKEIPVKIKDEKEEIIESKFSIPEKYIPEIESFLSSEDKFDIIKEILDYYIVREEKNKLLVFLLLSGAYSNNYQIIIVVGDSSGGKSHIGENIVALYPKKNTWTLTGASDKALIYKEWNSEKIIHIPEGQRNEEILENIKDFGDQGIVYNTVEKNEQNRFETREIVIGKKSVITTTTIDQLNTQLENRAWKIEPDLSREQSKCIIDKTLERKKDLINKMKREEEIKEKENLLKLSILTFENNYNFDNIEICFSEVLLELLNYNFIKIRRDHKKFLALIEIITAWNYKIREGYELKGKKVLLAHPNDLITAFEVGEEIFMNLTGNLTPDKRKILECFQNMPEEPKKEKNKQIQLLDREKIEQKPKVKTNDVYDIFCEKTQYKKSLKSFRNLLNSLSEDGYIEKEKKGRDNEYSLRDGAIIKMLDEQQKREIYLKSFEEYNHRKEVLQSMEEIKFYVKKIDLISLKEIALFSKEIYQIVYEMFKDNETKILPIEKVYYRLKLDYPSNYEQELGNMIKLGLFKKNFNEELIFEQNYFDNTIF